MADDDLALAEHAVLGLLVEGPAHGFALARHLSPDGDVGRVYSVARSAVYRAVDRLVAAGLAKAVRDEPGVGAPARTIVAATAAGRRTSARWVATPVVHVRDVRTALLVKLALLDRRGVDASALLARQAAALAPQVASLTDAARTAQGFDRTVALWRATAASAALAFVEAAAASPSGGD